MLSKKINHKLLPKHKRSLSVTYCSHYFDEPVPKFEIPENPMPPQAAYQIIADELSMDGNPNLNLATFVNTWMEPEARQLYLETVNKNFIDQDEYPQTHKIHQRTINMLARLFNAPEDAQSVGTATIGSSEAIMLGLLAHKWTWKKRRQTEGKPFDNPNIIFGADVHTSVKKFGLYFDVEMRIVPMEKTCYTMTARDVAELIDENTVAVCAILGTTYTGQADDIQNINELLSQVKKEKGWDIPLHVDAASGGFIAPFVYPDLEWDFRLSQVKSINVSNHKFGLVYPGMGSLIFRDESDLPKELIFHISYLGGDMPNYSLNFSRSSSTVLLQYYNFIRFGKNGYRAIIGSIMDNTRYLREQLIATNRFEPIGESTYVPVIVLRLKNGAQYTVFQVSEVLREHGWIIPAYTMPPNVEDIAVLRIVVKENFSRDMAENLVDDMKQVLKRLDTGMIRFETKQSKSPHRDKVS